MSPQQGSTGGALPGLVKGLATTARTMLRPAHTAEYPDAPPALPPRSRGVIALLEENCTSCMLCARECPDWCIYIDSHKETLPAETPGGRERQRNVLDRFAIDFSLCMYCGICIEVCPFDALFWSPQFEYAETDIRDLLHEKERLAEWMPTVPPPPALDEHSAEPAELTRANKAARGGDRAAPGARPRRVEAGRQTRPTGGTGAQRRTSEAERPESRTEVIPAPAARSDQTERLPAAKGDQTEQLPAAKGDRTEQLPAAEGDRTEQLPAAKGDQTEQLPAAEGDRTERLPAAKGDQTEQLPAAEGDDTQTLPTPDEDRTPERRDKRDDS